MQQTGRSVLKKYSQEFFESQILEILEWPANSRKLSSVENLWKILKDMIEKNNPKNQLDLINAIHVAACTILREIQQSLMNSLPNRIKCCISVHGETNKH